MINFLNRLLVSFLLLIISESLLQAQTVPAQYQEEIAFPRIEKTYLHTDRDCYTLGESLWYKAYNVYAYTNLLFDQSKILYVELVSPDSKIIACNKTRLEGGLGHGDFKLKSTIGVKAGIYQIRAYTNYSRNFGDDFVYKKEIEIIDVFDNVKVKVKESSSKTITKNTVAKTQSAFKIQFFPEGGSLINNIESVIAFKAVDNNGNPIKAQGKVYDSSNELVTFFGSLHDGMGKFQLKPEQGKTYYAEITSNSNQIKAPLPKAEGMGYVLAYKKVRGNDILTIKTNQETLSQQSDPSLTLVCKTRGITYFKGKNSLTETEMAFELPKTDFPEGISQITLYDANLKPQSERLVYIEKDNDVQVAISTDKKTYKPNEKVTVNISSKTELGKAVPASYSLSCTDTNGVIDAKDYTTNISSYFLMQSDIKGKINNPSYYFDASNLRRLVHLDLLLLTQGWRYFLWKKMPKVNDELSYKSEKGFVISGSVTQLFGDKPKINNMVNLTLFSGGGFKGLNTVTDSLGYFEFDAMAFMGKSKLFLNTKNKKGKGTGKIELYPLTEKPITIDLKKNKSTNYKAQTNTLKETVYKKYTLNGIAPENILDEVEIIAKKKNYVTAYGDVDYSYLPNEEESQYIDIYQLIQAEIPGVQVDPIERTIKFLRFDGVAGIIVNDVMLTLNDLDFIQPNEVAKIDAYKTSTTLFGSEGVNGIIAIYLKDGGSIKNTKKVFHSITKKIEGFYDARIFYNTDPNKPSIEDDHSMLSVRNTLYWNPYVHPDATGNSKISYFNSDVQTQVKLTLEGLTASGIPVVVKTNYTIDK